MKKILKQAKKIGAPEEKFPSYWLLVHRNDLKCSLNPNHQLKKEIIAGRSAVYCPFDQK